MERMKIKSLSKIPPLGGIFRNSPTVGSTMADHKGAGPGFDAVRIGLALAILFWHCFPLVYGEKEVDIINSKFYPLVISLVPMFFCVSGFLVTGSAVRTKSVRLFLTNRILRIFPALTVEVALSAFILGPLVTSVPLSEYFRDSKFFEYFLNILGMPHYVLPGVFSTNPSTAVNGSLWTLQPEYYCYLFMTLLMLSAVVYKRTLFTAAFFIALVVLSAINLSTGYGMAGALFPTVTIIYSFFVGILFFHWKEKIPVSFPLFMLSAIYSYFMISHRPTFISMFPLAYCVLYVGMLRIPRIPLLQKGDYSYGIYLFSFPIIQFVVWRFPVLNTWWAVLFVATPLSIVFSALSWHFVEKPFLKLKGKLMPVSKNAVTLSAAPAIMTVTS